MEAVMKMAFGNGIGFAAAGTDAAWDKLLTGAIVAELTEKLQNAASGVLVDYKGITVAEDTALRVELRENGVKYIFDPGQQITSMTAAAITTPPIASSAVATAVSLVPSSVST